jgi:hypothetical protein
MPYEQYPPTPSCTTGFDDLGRIISLGPRTLGDDAEASEDKNMANGPYTSP